MKKQPLPFLIGLAAVLLLFSACKKDYYQDSGLAKGKFDGTVLQYLKARPDYFKNLVKTIEMAQMEDILSKEEITFFAPGDASIDSTIRYTNLMLYATGLDTIKSIADVPPQVWREMLGRYIFRGKIMLNDVPQVDWSLFSTYHGEYMKSYDDVIMHLGVVYHDEGSAKYVGYRQLFISYAPSPELSSGPSFIAPVASVNIEPTNGVVHAIQTKTHLFGFSLFEFYNRCIFYGVGHK
ncbi:hypothetical protein [Chitinophaga sp. Cy-1792]|uniref:hypothetical protein n=1 Tax=Chitinophaga sp. Cy-1792 TaxID=2608339 RepID=UPI00141EDFA0|nr:hypothetical protein [Chitinophaga sp. Cy-1792]NIG54180.1 hypothetical protein [Chitinophaga sp. Cy-1792]